MHHTNTRYTIFIVFSYGYWPFMRMYPARISSVYVLFGSVIMESARVITLVRGGWLWTTNKIETPIWKRPILQVVLG